MLVGKRFPVTLFQCVETLSETTSLQRQLASRLAPLAADCQ